MDLLKPAIAKHPFFPRRCYSHPGRKGKATRRRSIPRNLTQQDAMPEVRLRRTSIDDLQARRELINQNWTGNEKERRDHLILGWEIGAYLIESHAST